MKSITLKIVLPLTIISFVTISKWWYTVAVDAPDTIFTGFPFPYVCNGWHTSLSLQIFVFELIFDFITYFFILFVIFYIINHYVLKLKIYQTVTISLWTISSTIILFITIIAVNPDNLFYAKRPFKMNVIDTGIKIGWNPVQKPLREENGVNIK